ncbi:MAG: hypothetical protein H7X97_07085 [Opitutaceae bacterium]|nr:hypothetical protein [Verrucomicrobiales bacterium]
MASASASSSASTGINAPGGSINKNSPGIWIVAILAVVVMFYFWNRRKS